MHETHGARRGDEGFTLVELMMVVLIISILIAIAVPTFFGARREANDRATQSDLRNALTAAKIFYASALDYDVTEAELEAIEPALDFAPVASASQLIVGFAIGDVGTNVNQAIVLVKQSGSGTWFCIADQGVGGPPTRYLSDGALTSVDTPAECTGAAW